MVYSRSFVGGFSMYFLDRFACRQLIIFAIYSVIRIDVGFTSISIDLGRRLYCIKYIVYIVIRMILYDIV
ncbi:hypothetical protein C2G38_2072062 [Gigaspora rosea]|uniref:Uncharacterized protein n=1 Tax=Gigaspora rosea TaxID=44941 RepID=A0A397VXF1_9GLOM|nr:hypothetical protein C2G38_2072062 [Gigaspora rosea]